MFKIHWHSRHVFLKLSHAQFSDTRTHTNKWRHIPVNVEFWVFVSMHLSEGHTRWHDGELQRVNKQNYNTYKPVSVGKEIIQTSTATLRSKAVLSKTNKQKLTVSPKTWTFIRVNNASIKVQCIPTAASGLLQRINTQ